MSVLTMDGCPLIADLDAKVPRLSTLRFTDDETSAQSLAVWTVSIWRLIFQHE